MLRKISLGALVVLAVTLPLFAGGFYTVTQADEERAIQPLAGNVGAEDYYDYQGAPAYSSQNEELVEDRVSKVFLYRDPNDRVYLFMVHGPPEATSTAEFRVANVPNRADWVVKDDPPNVDSNDVYDLAAERVTWNWGGNRTDGGVLGPLGSDFEITLTPIEFPGEQEFVFLTGDVAAPQRFSLNRRDAIVITHTSRQPPTARFDIAPVEPRARQEIVFDADASDHDPDLRIDEYRWDFGDGVTRTTTEPRTRHVYTEGGTYEVKLTVVDNEGRTDTRVASLFVTTVTVSATRSISTTEALPASTFLVTVRIRAEQDLVGVGLEESVPVGWQVTPKESAGAVFNRPATQWVFLDTIRAGAERVISYEVTVPKAEEMTALRLPQRFCITGIFQAKTPDFEVEVGGESCLVVTDCLSIVTAIAHLVPASSPGDRDRLDLRLSEAITKEQLARAGELWRTDQAVVGTCGERISLSTLKKLAAYAESCTPVDQPFPELPRPDLQAVRTILTPIPCEGVVMGFYDASGKPLGNKFTVKVEITSDVDVMGVGLEEELPVGWRVTPVQNDGFLYKPSTNAWAYLGTMKGGRTKVIIYEVEVPPTTTVEAPPTDDCRVLSAEPIVGRADTGLPCVEVDVRGDSRVDLTDCLDVIVAISRWDVKQDKIDLLLSDKISFEQVQRAVAFWLEGEQVPRTCYPSTVGYETLKQIVALWLTGTPICDVLPGAPPEVCEGR